MEYDKYKLDSSKLLSYVCHILEIEVWLLRMHKANDVKVRWD